MSRLSQPSKSELSARERAILEEYRRRSMRDDSLLAFVPRLNPRYQSPVHLAPLAQAVEEAVAQAQTAGRQTLQVVSSVAPRFGKTELLLNGIGWGLARRPELTFGYVSYSNAFAWSKSRKAQAVAVKAGVELATRNVAEWRTLDGGGVLATGIGSLLTGHGLDIAIVDDPYKNRLYAESSAYRNRIWDWFNDVLTTRIEPGGAVIVNMARWHPDDLIGRLIAEEGDRWRAIRMPALNDRNESLWPERWPTDLLLAKKARVGEYTWASLYQGQPKPRGGALFGDPRMYEKPPERFVAKAIGIDLAYSKKTTSDYSVAIAIGIANGVCYLLDVVRRQQKAPDFKRAVHALWEAHGRPDARWYGYGPELGIGDFLRDGEHAIPVQIMQAPGDKFIRAQPVSAAWNAGAVLLPEEAGWIDDFVTEVCNFTGVNDDHDDQVDALGAAYDILAPYRPERTVSTPEPGTPDALRAEARAIMERLEQEALAQQAQQQGLGDSRNWEWWARMA